MNKKLAARKWDGNLT